MTLSGNACSPMRVGGIGSEWGNWFCCGDDNYGGGGVGRRHDPIASAFKPASTTGAVRFVGELELGHGMLHGIGKEERGVRCVRGFEGGARVRWEACMFSVFNGNRVR